MAAEKLQKLVTPNQLSALRIVLVVPILWALSSSSYPWQYLGVELYVLAAILDILDGDLARSTNQITSLGKILDPLSDKVLNLPIFWYLGRLLADRHYWFYLTSLMISLDLILLVIAQTKHYFADRLKLQTGANSFGKLKMGFEVGSILGVFYFKPYLDLNLIPQEYQSLALLPAQLALLIAIVFSFGSLKGHLTPTRG